jgi:transcriptional regulator with XRE-family HTH domain
MKHTSLSRMLRANRLITGQEQDELAAEIGISQTAVSRAERGKPISEDQFNKIVEWMRDGAL